MGAGRQNIGFDFYGDSVAISFDCAMLTDFNDSLTATAIYSFYDRVNKTDYQPLIAALTAYKTKHNPDDWLLYQLIRKTAEAISPKAADYNRYTLYKWFLLTKMGYNATINVSEGRMLFYVQSNDNIYDIPCYTLGGKQYVCLNYHDFKNTGSDPGKVHETAINIPGAVKSFSYKLTRLPDFNSHYTVTRQLEFNYHDNDYLFSVKLNPEIKKIFTNYPVADYQLYFNIPLSADTYNSLIPKLKKNLKGLKVQDGVDYLMHFTRYAFKYETDAENFGKEKRLLPEQTLLYDHSDCEDRAALFYYLVKELYNLPMIVLSYPHHLTVAVKFDRPIGNPILFNGSAYSPCEPTPQGEDLPIGRFANELNKEPYEVAFAYNP